MKFRSAFTMLELVFVIVIMGIIGKFGVEFLAQAYKGFIFTNVNNTLQGSSATAVEFISIRLQDRIKDSIIARASDTNFTALGSASGEGYTILEWVGTDVDGFRGNSDVTPNLPNWSGIVDVNPSTNTILNSPATDTTKTNDLIIILSDGNSSINDAALYFVGSSSDIQTGYGWNASIDGAFHDQNHTMHRINSVAGDVTKFTSIDGNFSEIYEYYKLAWTAYAVAMEDYNTTTKMGTLKFYYNYQPWNGEKYSDGNSSTIMENVSTFRFMAIGSLVKIQVCTKSNLVEEYSLCKEKTVY